MCSCDGDGSHASLSVDGMTSFRGWGGERGGEERGEGEERKGRERK